MLTWWRVIGRSSLSVNAAASASEERICIYADASTEEKTVIPVVELGVGAGGRGAIARRIAEACEQVSFLAITGHGVPDAVLRASRLAMADYFALPLETKLRDAISGPDSPYDYSPLEGESLAATRARQGATRDYKESFSIGPTDRACLAANR
jgi:isopenicillin N synthase-like dioxygenase